MHPQTDKLATTKAALLCLIIHLEIHFSPAAATKKRPRAVWSTCLNINLCRQHQLHVYYCMRAELFVRRAPLYIRSAQFSSAYPLSALKIYTQQQGTCRERPLARFLPACPWDINYWWMNFHKAAWAWGISYFVVVYPLKCVRTCTIQRETYSRVNGSLRRSRKK